MDYVHLHDRRKFSWKRLQEIEEKTIIEGEKIMPPLKYSLELEREEGREEGREELVINLLKNGVDPRIISRSSKLSLEQIQNLQEKFKKKKEKR